MKQPTMAIPWSWIFLIASLKLRVLGRKFTDLCMESMVTGSSDSKPINKPLQPLRCAAFKTSSCSTMLRQVWPPHSLLQSFRRSNNSLALLMYRGPCPTILSSTMKIRLDLMELISSITLSILRTL